VGKYNCKSAVFTQHYQDIRIILVQVAKISSLNAERERKEITSPQYLLNMMPTQQLSRRHDLHEIWKTLKKVFVILQPQVATGHLPFKRIQRN
jgi:hypothetical protein